MTVIYHWLFAWLALTRKCVTIYSGSTAPYLFSKHKAKYGFAVSVQGNKPLLISIVSVLIIFLLCFSKAYQSRRYYPNYLWIVPGWYSDNWWREFPDYLTTLNCTLTQVEQVLNRSLTFLPVPGHLNSTTAGVITTLLNPSSYAADAVKALALALNDSLNISSCSEMPEQCIQRRLTDRLRSVEFTGTSVSVETNECLVYKNIYNCHLYI